MTNTTIHLSRLSRVVIWGMVVICAVSAIWPEFSDDPFPISGMNYYMELALYYRVLICLAMMASATW